MVESVEAEAVLHRQGLSAHMRVNMHESEGRFMQYHCVNSKGEVTSLHRQQGRVYTRGSASSSSGASRRSLDQIRY